MDKNLKFTTAILDAFEDGIYVTNQDHIVEYMNSAMIADFGDGIGKNCHQLLNQSDQKCKRCIKTCYLCYFTNENINTRT